MRFLGPKLHLKNDMFPEERLGEVMVLQQHCGGSSLCVFRELLPPNSKCIVDEVFGWLGVSIPLILVYSSIYNRVYIVCVPVIYTTF